MEDARMDMHYQPSAAEVGKAKAVIRMALQKLFPERDSLPEELRRLVPEGRVFPQSWDGQIVVETSEQTAASNAAADALFR